MASATLAPVRRAGDRRWLSLAFIGADAADDRARRHDRGIALPSAQAAVGASDADRQWVVTA